jgi:hypothetical protein
MHCTPAASGETQVVELIAKEPVTARLKLCAEVDWFNRVTDWRLELPTGVA